MTAKAPNLLSLFLLLSLSISAQKSVTRQSLYWVRYYNQLTFNDKWSWHHEVDNRRFFEHNRQHHLIMHSHIHYKPSENTEVAFGLTYSLQSPHDPDAVVRTVVPERRLFQECSFNKSLSNRLNFHQRLRIDERFIRRNNGNELQEGYDFNFRFRYRLQLTYILSKPEASLKTTLKLANELMLNAGKVIVYNHFDQNRLYFGLEQGLSHAFSAELGYLHWYQQRPAGASFFARDIVRFTLYHRWVLKKK